MATRAGRARPAAAASVDISKESSSSDVDSQKIQEYKAAFNLFSGGQDKLDAAQLKSILSKFGIKDASAEQMIKEGDTKGAGYLDVTDFITMMTKKMAKADSEDDLTLAFQKFDWRKTFTIPTPELSEALTNLGKPLNSKELSAMLDVCEKEGSVHYALFVKALFGEDKKQ
eukprot:TRINITY_DN2751_c0_g1_i1.p1 TRINITY_DN2751_c0_g1~~TRINITY_DN2751_c0_g1_i1.p1  ORF type:complete len:171 (-),score=37.11 TRINITY_DN2751_c0_g1_i1:84-596(-)